MASISVCMIVKNEESNIAKCLESIKDIADEIIIVDTGSNDKTINIAKEICKKFRLNAKFFDFKWIDDFSAARNESIKHAAKEWILIIDADEELEKESISQIKELTGKNEVNGYLFLQRNYTNESSIAGFVDEEHSRSKEKYKGWYGSFIVRLFKNNKGYEFMGTVHELVEQSIAEKNGKISATTIILNHYGNADPKIVREKRKKYLELCKGKANSRKDSSSYFELGVLYKENGNLEEAKKSLEKSLKINTKNHLALYELGILNESQKDYDNAIKNYKDSLRIRESSEVFQNLGVCYMKKGMLKESYRNLVKALLLNPNKFSIYNNLGAVMEKSGKYDQAIQMLDIATKLNPKNTIGFYNLGIACDKKGDFEKAMISYKKATDLGHPKREEIKNRISQLKAIIASNPKYGYSFSFGNN